MPTSRFALPYPAGSTPNNVPLHLQQLADAVDAQLGAITTMPRPAAGIPGRFHLNTTTDLLSYDTGTVWVSVSRLPSLIITRRSTAQTGIASGTPTQVTGLSDTLDDGGDASSTGIVIPRTGWWFLYAVAAWPADVTGQVAIHYRVNGGAWTLMDNRPASPYDQAVANGGRHRFCTAGDVIQVGVEHTTGSPKSLSSLPEFSAEWKRD